MKRIKVIDLLYSVIIPAIVLLLSFFIPRFLSIISNENDGHMDLLFSLSLSEKIQWEAVYGNDFNGKKQIICYRCDISDCFFSRLKNVTDVYAYSVGTRKVLDNTCRMEVQLESGAILQVKNLQIKNNTFFVDTFSGNHILLGRSCNHNFMNLLKEENFQIFISIVILSLFYIVIVSCLLKFNSFLIFLFYAGGLIYVWLSGIYLDVSYSYLMLVSMLCLTLMIISTAYGIYKYRTYSKENKIGVLGTWRVLTKEDGSDDEKWIFQKYHRLFIVKGNSVRVLKWAEFTEINNVTHLYVTDNSGITEICHIERIMAEEEIVETILKYNDEILVKFDSKYNSIDAIEDDVKHIKDRKAVVDRLFRIKKKKRYSVCAIVFMSSALLVVVGCFFFEEISSLIGFMSMPLLFGLLTIEIITVRYYDRDIIYKIYDKRKK